MHTNVKALKERLRSCNRPDVNECLNEIEMLSCEIKEKEEELVKIHDKKYEFLAHHYREEAVLKHELHELHEKKELLAHMIALKMAGK